MSTKYYSYMSLTEIGPRGAMWWSNEDGWVEIDNATRFTFEETQTLNKPMGPCIALAIHAVPPFVYVEEDDSSDMA